eukprot:11222190-Lingulodinium_polyedra.AAC.1
MVTFDGGSRTVDGFDVGAGAAVVWHKVQGQWSRLFTWTKAFPCGAAARAAEARAGRAALEVLRHATCPPGLDLSAGDNLAVV